jgi:glycosyltransferase involved in cell wall biosynthesis
LIQGAGGGNQDLLLLIAGGRGWMYEQVFEEVEKLGLRDRVIFPDFFRDDDLPALYALASLFVFPSLYEGFGLPIAEAMACGTPVVCTNASSVPEVGGDAVLYFDPLDVDGMAKEMRIALTDGALRNEMRTKGFAQASKFSWEKAAGELKEYLVGRRVES